MRYYRIKDLSEECQISRKTIRFYEERGILEPREKEGNVRLYGDQELLRLKCICFYRSLGFSLADIQQIMKDKNNRECIRGIIEKLKQQVSETMFHKVEAVRRIDYMLENIGNHEDSGVQLQEYLKDYEEEKDLVTDTILWRFNNCYQTYQFTCTRRQYHYLITSFKLFAGMVIFVSLFAIITKLMEGGFL